MDVEFQCSGDDFYNVLTTPDVSISMFFFLLFKLLFYLNNIQLQLVSAFTNQTVKFQAVKGGKFQLFDGNITGEFVELVSKYLIDIFDMNIHFLFKQCPGKKIVQNWRTKQWPDWLYSTVTVSINQQEDHTKVKVTLVGVPKR